MHFYSKIFQPEPAFAHFVEHESWINVALNIAGVEKMRSDNLRLRSTWRPFDWSFERKGALVMVEICVLCGRWFSNQFEIVSETPFSCDTVGR